MPTARFPIQPVIMVSVALLLTITSYGSLQSIVAQEATPPGHDGSHAASTDQAGTPSPDSDSPYAGAYDPNAPIRALSSELVEQIRQGQGASLALPAELNGVPGPRHVLELRADLDLTPDQQNQVQEIFDQYLVDVIPAGERYLAAVQGLEEGFRAQTVMESELPGFVAEIGRLEADLVTVHLAAHLRTAELLTPDQIAAYNRLRGYE